MASPRGLAQQDAFSNGYKTVERSRSEDEPGTRRNPPTYRAIRRHSV